ncbi:MAG: hypothetical protein ACI33P_09340, partial [Lysinibacillus sp.]
MSWPYAFFEINKKEMLMQHSRFDINDYGVNISDTVVYTILTTAAILLLEQVASPHSLELSLPLTSFLPARRS